MEEEVIEKKKLSPKTKRIINIVIDVVVAVVLAFALLLAICAISSKAKGYKQYTEIFGSAYLAVETDSMTYDAANDNRVGFGNFSEGDLIKIKTVNSSEARKFKVGDVITFKTTRRDDGKIVLLTHRIIEVLGEEGNATSYKTRGDKYPNATPETVKIDEIVGVYKGKAGGIGKVLLFMSTSTGFFVCVVLPTLLIVVYCAVNLVFVIRKEKKKQTIEAVQEKEDERERIRQELLAEMQASNAQAPQPDEEPNEAQTEAEAQPDTEQQPAADEEPSTEENKTDEEEK